ncbi:MAG: Hpt domain-containing protein [Proteobacteria bacterium]|nr:Hpt domain-containing protein [Pseudomonadota bacterium]MBI3499833.1 Hpt domain-containing protein [Pseudomonadota bacterium]
MGLDLERLWEEFQNEAEEHLATSDRLIDQALQRALAKGEIGELFRAFHSLKGMARVMGLGGLEQIAHWTESLLGLVRDRGVALDEELLQGLAVAVDQMDQMLTEIARAHADVSAPAELLAALVQLNEKRGEGGATAPSGAEPPPPSAGGNEMHGLLAELMREFLPGIAQLAAPSIEAEAAAGIADPVVALTNAAEVLQLPEFGEILAGLAAFAGPIGPESLAARHALLARLHAQAIQIGKLAGADAGADAFAAALAPLMQLQAAGEGATGAAEEAEASIAGLALPAEFHPLLSAESRRDLERAVGDGQSVYAVEVAPDGLEGGGAFERLAEIGNPIARREVPGDGESRVEVLLVSPLAEIEMRGSVAALDPNRRWIKAVRPIGESVDRRPTPSGATDAQVAAQETGSAAEPGQAGESLVLRVRSVVLDRLMASVGDARVIAGQLSQTLLEDRRKADALSGLHRMRETLPVAIAAELGRHLETLRERETELAALDGKLATALSQLHADALDLRVVPVETVLARLPRVAREVAQSQGKRVHIRIEGREVRIDKSVVQQLLEPLMHMMRNAVDHGIETPAEREAAGKKPTATITLSALQRASEFRLEVADDGRGLDADAIARKAVERGLATADAVGRLPPERIYRFIFEAGFSTAKAVTETSGRGVGMDVVLHTLNRLGGSIDIRSEKGAGTTFVLRLPLSAAVLPSLLIEAAGQALAIPERNIVSVEEIVPERIRQAGGRRVLLRGNLVLPLYPLSGLIGLGAQAAGGGHAVVVASGRASIALAVDRLLRRQELLLRDLHPALAALPGVGGAALLGDGSPVLVLDVDVLIELARSGGARAKARAAGTS